MLIHEYNFRNMHKYNVYQMLDVCTSQIPDNIKYNNSNLGNHTCTKL